MTHIGVEQYRVRTSAGEGDGQIGRHEATADTGARAADGQCPPSAPDMSFLSLRASRSQPFRSFFFLLRLTPAILRQRKRGSIIFPHWVFCRCFLYYLFINISTVLLSPP